MVCAVLFLFSTRVNWIELNADVAGDVVKRTMMVKWKNRTMKMRFFARRRFVWVAAIDGCSLLSLSRFIVRLWGNDERVIWYLHLSKRSAHITAYFELIFYVFRSNLIVEQRINRAQVKRTSERTGEEVMWTWAPLSGFHCCQFDCDTLTEMSMITTIHNEFTILC